MARRHRTPSPAATAVKVARQAPWWVNVLTGAAAAGSLFWLSRAPLLDNPGPFQGLYDIAQYAAGLAVLPMGSLYVGFALYQLVRTKRQAHHESRRREPSEQPSAMASFTPPSRALSPEPTKPDTRNLSERIMESGQAYISQATLLTPAEVTAYRHLMRLYGDTVAIFCKVRVADVITPDTRRHAKHSREFASLFRQISQWHLDFVLVDPGSFKILCALELDDSSHQRPDRQKRDRILNSAFLNADVRLERLTLQGGGLKAEPITNSASP